MNVLQRLGVLSVVRRHVVMSARSVRLFSSGAAPSQLELIKELRRRTGAGIGDCKKALESSHNDIDLAMQHLQSQALAAFTKEGALSTQGSIGVARRGSRGALVDLSSQTDFVSRNERFSYVLQRVSNSLVADDGVWQHAAPEMAVLEVPPERLENIELAAPSDADANAQVVASDEALASASTIGEAVSQLRFMFKEDIKIRRSVALGVHETRGVVGAYKHGDGKFAALVGLVVDRPNTLTPEQRARLQEIGDRLAVHVVARSPLTISTEDASDDESASAVAVAVTARPEPTAEPLLTPEGGEVDMHALAKKQKPNTVMLEQPFALDEQLVVREWLKQQSAAAGVPIIVRGFVRLERGQTQTASTL